MNWKIWYVDTNGFSQLDCVYGHALVDIIRSFLSRDDVRLIYRMEMSDEDKAMFGVDEDN